MPYLGNPPAEAYTSTVKDSFSGDGSTTAFTLSQPSTTNDLRVVVENVIQDPTVAYSVSGTTLTFTSAPPTGTNNIYAVNLGPAVQTVVPPDGVTLTNPTVTGDLTVDTNTLFVDSTNNNVGIGTISPNNVAGFGGLTLDGTSGSLVDLEQNGTLIGRLAVGSNQVDIHNKTDNPIAFIINSTTKARIDSDGLKFNSDTAAANALDDYEEGTWTPTYDATSTDPVVTYGVQVGTYTKVGNMVTVWFRIRTSSIISQGTNTLRVANLPFTNTSSTNIYGGFTLDYANDWNSGNSPGGGYVNVGGTVITLQKRKDADARSDLDTGVAANNLYTGGSANDIIGCAIYMTD